MSTWKGKAVQDNLVESWACVDCGRDTAPGTPSGPAARRALKRWGRTKVRVDARSEYYMLRDAVWRKAGMDGWGGCLCVGCIEKPRRLGRKLTPEDFDWTHVFNGFPGTRRLLARRKYTLLRRDETRYLFVASERPAFTVMGGALEKHELPWDLLARHVVEFAPTVADHDGAGAITQTWPQPRRRR